MDLCDPTIVSGEEAEEHVCEIEAGVAVEPPHDAEINDDDRAVGVDKHVSGMKIGVEEPVAEYLVEERFGRPLQQIFEPVPGSENCRSIIDTNASDPLQGKHGAAGAQPIDARDSEIGIAREILAELGGCRSLESQIHLESDHLGERLHDLNRLQPAKRGLKPFGQPREPKKKIEIASERLGNARPQHLDSNLVPVRRTGEMDLGDRRCSYGRWIK
jgi:hypothetical protein